MHVGYCEVYSYSFRLFFDTWSESTWNSLFIPQERKFQGMKVLGTFAPVERKFHGSECSRKRKFLERLLPRNEISTGTKVPRSECSTERKFHGNKSSICGLFAPGNENAEERKVRHSL